MVIYCSIQYPVFEERKHAYSIYSKKCRDLICGPLVIAGRKRRMKAREKNWRNKIDATT